MKIPQRWVEPPLVPGRIEISSTADARELCFL
jgi:hypothetical protein